MNFGGNARVLVDETAWPMGIRLRGHLENYRQSSLPQAFAAGNILLPDKGIPGFLIFPAGFIIIFLAKGIMENDETINALQRRVVLHKRPSFALVIALLGFLALINLILSFKIDQFELIFSEMLGDKPLPAATQLVIMAGRSGAMHLVSFLLPFAAYVSLATNKGKRFPWLLAFWVVLFQILQAAFVIVALFIPMNVIIVSLEPHP